VRATLPALDLVFVFLLVFAAALAFADFVFFPATMHPPSAPSDHVAWPRPQPNQRRSMEERDRLLAPLS
jgi:hypothetical protein